MDFGAALEMIREHILDGRHRDNPQLAGAIDTFDKGLPLHHCYNNDRFAVAVLCDQPIRQQRKMAGLAWANAGFYWEWKTHFGFDTMAALKKLGIASQDARAPTHLASPPYYQLEGEYVTDLKNFAGGTSSPI